MQTYTWQLLTCNFKFKAKFLTLSVSVFNWSLNVLFTPPRFCGLYSKCTLLYKIFLQILHVKIQIHVVISSPACCINYHDRKSGLEIPETPCLCYAMALKH